MAKILVTGAAGFIGYHVSVSLLKLGNIVVGIDNINNYYDIKIKYARLAELGIKKDNVTWNQTIPSGSHEKFSFIRANIQNKEVLDNLFKEEEFDFVVHLAAQAGVRYSLENPYAYIDSNINAFINILEACRHNKIQHLVFASSSSVYGLNEKMPLSEKDNVDHPVSLYAATKKSNELMAHSYSHLYGLPTTGLRFFTVYGPWGRPDMALFLFTEAILKGEPIDVYNYGNMIRDFTFIDDIVGGVLKVLDKLPESDPDWSGMDPDPSRSPNPYRILNIGNNKPVSLMEFISAIEEELGQEAKKNFMPIQPGDVRKTYADTKELNEDYQYVPKTKISHGICEFIKWYKAFYFVSS